MLEREVGRAEQGHERSRGITTLLALLLGLIAAFGSAPARADFPYLPKSGGDPHNPATWKLPAGEAPSNLADDWKLAATPETPSFSDPSAPALLVNNAKPPELCGIRGDSIADSHAVQPANTGSCVPAGSPVRTAFNYTTGRPDVTIAVLDSGIEWNNPGAMTALRKKVHLNQGELPAPLHDLTASLEPGLPCTAFTGATGGDYNAQGNYDINGDGVFNVLDYACDSRVKSAMSDPRRHGPAGVLTPEDLIVAFSDGVDHDHSGFVNDIAGWNFVDDNNNPYDDVQYGHGTGEAVDSNGEANTTQALGTCPNCTVTPLRVGESFITDVNRFAQAVVYATDRGVDVVQEALGTLNNSRFARQAIDYAYGHGTTIIASAADEAAEHHNQPGALPHTIVVNSVVKYAALAGVPFTPASPSYLQFNGCTNFSTRVTVSVPSSSCSSEATGKGAGVAGLIYAAATNAQAAHTLGPSTDCHRVDGSPCLITPNEVRQLMASGNLGSTAPADTGAGQADDVNFMQEPEPSCSAAPLPSCTDPNLNYGVFSPLENGGLDGGLVPTTRRYPARKGFDEFYGYGRLNAYKALSAVASAAIPPEADITSPDWFNQIDPQGSSLPVTGHTSARSGTYTCELDVAPGGQPNNDPSPGGDFAASSGGFCDGSTPHTGSFDGTLGTVNLAALKARFPATLQPFNGNETGGLVQTSNGRPNTMPYAFTIRVVVRTAAASGEDRRQLYLHRDKDALAGFPKELQTDGASSPLLADLGGENRNELVLATSDGLVHAYRPDGSELPGWPVHTDPLPLHTGEHAYAAGGVGSDHYGAVLGGLAAGDLFHDGRTEIVADDNQGKVYAWDAAGARVLSLEANANFSGAPLAPLASVRNGPRDRVEHGFFAAPVLAHLDGNPNAPLDIVAAGEDRHLYAWHADGTPVSGFPVEMYDHDKASIDNSTTGHLTFNSNVPAHPGIDEDQGKIVDTPAIAQLDGPAKPPSIIVGTNESYTANVGDEGPINAGVTAASLGVIGRLGLLGFANTRLYAVGADGKYRAGWPKKVGIIDRGLLPDVGEGLTGSPVVGPLSCTTGGSGPKIAAIPDAGPGYVFNPDGSSCYGSANNTDNTLELDFSAGAGQYDHPAFPAVGNPAIGTLDGTTKDVIAPVTGLMRALDVVAPDYQGGQDFIAAWNAQTGQYEAGFPTPVNDLQFLTGQAVGDILGAGTQQIIGGTASLDLAAVGRGGLAASSAWPKLTGDWTVATPLLGSFGTQDTDPAAHKDVISITRSGELQVYGTPAKACAPSSWPRYHHDNANSGDYSRDATQPGVPYAGSLSADGTLSFLAPGGDGLCGTVDHYEIAASDQQITPQNFAAAQQLSGAPKPAAAGTRQTFAVPGATRSYIALRAVDAQGNLGLPLVVSAAGLGGPGGAGSGAGDGGVGSTSGGAGGSSASQGPTGSLGGRNACTSSRPYSRFARRRAHATRTGLRLSGTSRLRGAGCHNRIVRVAVSIARKSGKRCRYLGASRRLGSPVSCRRQVYLPAHGTTRWTFRFKVALRRGSYQVFVRATDAAGVVEHRASSHNFTRLRVR